MINQNSIYISAIEPRSGTLIVSIGIMEILKAYINKVAYFRPIVDNHKECENINFMLEYFKLDMSYEDAKGYDIKRYQQAYANNKHQELIDDIVVKVQKLYEKFDFVLIEGYPSTLLASISSIDLNLSISSALSSLHIPIINVSNKTVDEIYQEFSTIQTNLQKTTATHIATIFNQVIPSQKKFIQQQINSKDIYFIEQNATLLAPTVWEIQKHTNASIIKSPKEQLHKTVSTYQIASMQTTNYIKQIQNHSCIITSSDRVDIVLSSILLQQSKKHAYISAILLCEEKLNPDILGLIKHTDTNIPILHTDKSIVETIDILKHIKPSLYHTNRYKINIAKSLFDKAQIDVDKLLLNISKPKEIVTTSMFKYHIIKQAQQNRQNIVLPESSDERVLIATHQILQRDIADITLLGDKDSIKAKALELHIDISKASIIDIEQSNHKESFAKHYYNLRKHKGITIQQAQEIVCKPNYFGVMMIECGLADGMVCGAVYTTADTIRPALQIIGTQDGVDIVSSLFFMGLDSGLVIYADCAINVNPNAKELATIAISTAKSAKAFGIEPKVAMLSYSSGNSGKGVDVDKIKEALQIVKEKYPTLLIDGPMQYDTAIDKDVASVKMPNSKVAGEANVFIFPDLNSGNNTYKAVQRSTNTTAIGPILQGLQKPINDLSRGCSIEDIANTIMITSIQAQNKEDE